ncbi:MAG: hypothetical protein E7678_07005 [Ruminococcaceae bacterium]|nr:hypothetical protein [Oscillospiraceae bacterium]
MKKNIISTILLGIIVFVIFYQFYPQYCECDIKYIEGSLNSVSFASTGRGGNWIIELDNGPVCYVREDELGKTLKSSIGKFINIGYTTNKANIRHDSAYLVIDLDIENKKYIDIEQVNKENAIGYFVIELIVILFFTIVNIWNIIDIVKTKEEKREKLRRKEVKKKKKEKYKERFM